MKRQETLALRFSLVQPNISGIMGRVLTIIDASITGEQNKAMKDLVRQEFNKTLNWLEEIASTPKNIEAHGEFGFPFEGEVVPVE